jgi:hypothetical protein
MFHWIMIFSDLPSPAEAGFAKSGKDHALAPDLRAAETKTPAPWQAV